MVNTIPSYSQEIKRKQQQKSSVKHNIICTEHNQVQETDETIKASQSTDSESTASCDDSEEEKFQNETSNDVESGGNYNTTVVSNKQ